MRVALLPQLRRREGEERERSGAAFDRAHHLVEEGLTLEGEARALRRLDRGCGADRPRRASRRMRELLQPVPEGAGLLGFGQKVVAKGEHHARGGPVSGDRREPCANDVALARVANEN